MKGTLPLVNARIPIPLEPVINFHVLLGLQLPRLGMDTADMALKLHYLLPNLFQGLAPASRFDAFQ